MSQKTEKKKKNQGEKPRMPKVGTLSPQGKMESPKPKAGQPETSLSLEKDPSSEKEEESLKDKEDKFRESVDKDPEAHASGDFDDLKDSKLKAAGSDTKVKDKAAKQNKKSKGAEKGPRESKPPSNPVTPKKDDCPTPSEQIESDKETVHSKESGGEDEDSNDSLPSTLDKSDNSDSEEEEKVKGKEAKKKDKSSLPKSNTHGKGKEKDSHSKLGDLNLHGERERGEESDESEKSRKLELPDYLKALQTVGRDKITAARMELQNAAPKLVDSSDAQRNLWFQKAQTCHQQCNPGQVLTSLKDIDNVSQVKAWTQKNSLCNTPAWLVYAHMTDDTVDKIRLRLAMRKDSLHITDVEEDFLNWGLHEWYDLYERFLAPSRGPADLDHANQEQHLATAKTYISGLPQLLDDVTVDYEKGLDLSGALESKVQGLRGWEKSHLAMVNFFKNSNNNKVLAQFAITKLSKSNSVKVVEIYKKLKAVDDVKKIVSFDQFFAVIVRHYSAIVANWLVCNPYLKFSPTRSCKRKRSETLGSRPTTGPMAPPMLADTSWRTR
jgi:hypothetical protein